MIIMFASEHENLAKQVVLVLWENKHLIKRKPGSQRLAVGVQDSNDGSRLKIYDILPGANGMMEGWTSLSDILPTFPEPIKTQLQAAAEQHEYRLACELAGCTPSFGH